MGRTEVVANLDVAAMADFHQRHLGATEAVLAIVGDVEVAEVRSQVEQLFAAMPKTPAETFIVPQMPHPQPGVFQFETGKPLAAVQVGIGPGMTRSSPDYPAMSVLSRLISDFPSGWLQQALRGEGPGLVYASHGWNQTGLAPGYFSIIFNTSPEQAPLALQRSMSVIERARAGEISDDDLRRARAKVLTGEFFGKQSNSARAMDLALDELYGVGDPTGRQFLAAVEAVDASTLHAVARRYLQQPVAVLITHQPIDKAALDAALLGRSAESAASQAAPR
jgi:zinc protease